MNRTRNISLLALFWIFLSLYPLKAQSSKETWKVVLVAATREPNISSGANAFLDKAERHFQRLSHVLGLDLNLTVLSGRLLNPKNVQSLRQELLSPTRPKAKLFTWVSFSHGFNTESSSSEFPYLIAHPTKTALSPQEMRYAFELEGFYRDLLASGNFEHVHIWAELCNQVCRGCKKLSAEGLASLGAYGGKQAMEDILYRRKGSLMVSSKYGQRSCVSKAGGPFQRALFEGLGMIERGEWQPSSPERATSEFLELIKNFTRVYLTELPELPCQEQEPQFIIND